VRRCIAGNSMKGVGGSQRRRVAHHLPARGKTLPMTDRAQICRPDRVDCNGTGFAGSLLGECLNLSFCMSQRHSIANDFPAHFVVFHTRGSLTYLIWDSGPRPRAPPSSGSAGPRRQPRCRGTPPHSFQRPSSVATPKVHDRAQLRREAQSSSESNIASRQRLQYDFACGARY
jgi:hypothetical protein